MENFTEYGIKYTVDSDLGKLNQINKSTDNLSKTLKSSSGSLQAFNRGFIKFAAVSGLSFFGLKTAIGTLQNTAFGMQSLSMATGLTIEEMTKLGIVMNQGINDSKSVKQVMQYSRSVYNLQRQFIALKNAAVLPLLQPLTKLSNKLTSSLIANQGKITSTIGTIGKAFETLSTTTFRAFSVVSNVFSSLMSNKVALTSLAIGLGSILAITNPFKTAFIGIIALLEDFYVWTQKGDSALGSLYDKLANLSPSMKKALGIGSAVGVASLLPAGRGVIGSVAKGVATVASAVNPYIAGGAAAIGGSVYLYNKFKRKREEDQTQMASEVPIPERAPMSVVIQFNNNTFGSNADETAAAIARDIRANLTKYNQPNGIS